MEVVPNIGPTTRNDFITYLEMTSFLLLDTDYSVRDIVLFSQSKSQMNPVHIHNTSGFQLNKAKRNVTFIRHKV